MLQKHRKPAICKTAATRATHSRHLIEIGGHTFLTDRWFSIKAGCYPGEPIAVTSPPLPRLDGVLISHAHYDLFGVGVASKLTFL